MVTRRTALKIAASGLVLPSLPACGTSASVAAYEEECRELWRHSPVTNAGMTAQQLDLVRYAVLAPSSHNTQCWQFLLGAADIAIVPDLSRRCPAVDPDDHHLFVSLGCATENLVQAARAHGFDGHVQLADVDGGAIRVALARAPAVRSTLFDAIPARQSTRSAYDGQPLARRELDLLAQAGRGAGVQLQLITDRPGIERVLEAVVHANTVQLHDDAFRRELTRWIRFNREEARRTGDGLFSGASGSPSVPRWLGRLVLDLVMQPGRDGDKYAEQIRSSAGLAVFSSDRDDTAHRVEVGRCFQRFALQATALDVRTAMINQPVEVAAVRAGFATMLGLGTRRPDLVVRFGHGPLLPRSLRRPVTAVLG
jgi:hypothetical protein